jgi:hypothetical protein
MKNPYEYDLLVHKDGTGTLRMIAKSPVAHSRVLSSDWSLKSEKDGGKIIVFPNDKNGLVLANSAGSEFYEIIIYRPE